VIVRFVYIGGIIDYHHCLNFHSINVLKFKVYVYSRQDWGKDSVNLSFVPVFKPYAHKLHILRHCTNVVCIITYGKTQKTPEPPPVITLWLLLLLNFIAALLCYVTQ
jgi:hypothetical protein